MPLWKNSLFANFLSLSSSSSSSSSPSSLSASTYSSLFATSRSSSSSSLSSDSFASTVVLFVFTITLAGFSSNWMLAPLGKNMELKNKDWFVFLMPSFKYLVNSLLSLDLKEDLRGIRSKSVSTTKMFPEVLYLAFTSFSTFSSSTFSTFSSSASSTEKLISPMLFCKWISEYLQHKTNKIYLMELKWSVWMPFTWKSRLFSIPPWAGVSFKWFLVISCFQIAQLHQSTVNVNHPIYNFVEKYTNIPAVKR